MKVAAYSGIMCNNKIWFSNIMANGLYRISMENGSLEYVTRFENENIFTQYLHKKVLKHNNKLIFIPLFSDTIIVFDIRNHTQTEIKIMKNKSEETISDATIVDDELVLFPLRINDSLIRVNLLNYSVEYDNEFTELFSNYVNGNEICIARCQRIDECVEFALYGTSYFVTYNLKTKQIIMDNVKIDNLYISYRRMDKSVVFITNDTSKIYVIYKDGSTEEYENNNGNGKRVYNGIIEYLGKTYIFPAFSNQLLLIEGHECKSVFIDFKEEEIINPNMPKFYGYICTDECIGLLPFQSKALYIVEDKTVSKIDIEEDYTIEKQHIKDISVFDENESFGLYIYLKALIKG